MNIYKLSVCVNIVYIIKYTPRCIPGQVGTHTLYTGANTCAYMPHGMHIFIPSRPFLVRAQSLSHVQLFVIPWAGAHQVPLSMGFPRQEYWSGLPFPPPGDLPDAGIKPTSRALQVDSLPLSH